MWSMEIQIRTYGITLVRKPTMARAVRTGSWSIWEVYTSLDTLLLPTEEFIHAAVSNSFF